MVMWVELGSVPAAGVHMIGAGPWLLGSTSAKSSEG
jgi:hypothetical protein